MKKLFGLLPLLFLIHFVQAQETKTPKVPIGGRPNIPSDLKVEFGFNVLNNRPADLSTGFFGSRTFNVFYQHPVSIFGEASGVTFNPGFGIATDKLAFNNDENLFNDPEKGIESSQLLAISEVYGENIQVNTNTFALSYFEVPLDFTYHLNKNNYYKGFKLTFGGRVGFLYNAHSKIEFKDENGLTRKIKDSQNYGFEKIRYGLSFKAGSPGFYVWSYFGLNRLFQENQGPFDNKAAQISFGIAVNLF